MRTFAAAAAAGVALGLSFEPYRLVLLLPLSIIVLLWCLRSVSVKRGASLGLVYGAAFMLTLLNWLRVIGWDAWLALSLFEALYFGLLGAGLAVVARSRLWPLWSAVLWVAVEAFRGAWPFGGLTWGRLAFAAIDTPLADWMPWVGATGVSLLAVLVPALVLHAGLRSRTDRRVVVVPAVAVAAVVLLPLPFTVPGVEDDGSIPVAVVQGNVPGRGDNLLVHHREVTRNHVESTRELGEEISRGTVERPAFVVWPENSTAVDPFRNGVLRDDLREAARAVGAPILVGGIVDATDPDQVLNQGIVFDPDSGAGDRYTKRHPVPFGEYIPYREHVPNRNFGRLALIPRDMAAGTRATPLDIGGVEVADLICFDVSYDDTLVDQVRGGAQLVVVQTSNALFIHTGQIEQQFAISRLRALETGRTVVVAAVNGRTGVIRDDGSVQAALEPRTRDVLTQTVALTRGSPPSMVVGPWLGRVAVVTALISVTVTLLPYRRRFKREETEESA